MAAALLSARHYFAKLPDPRINRRRRHKLPDIVLIALCAVTAGANAWQQVRDLRQAPPRLAGQVPGPAQRHPLPRHL